MAQLVATPQDVLDAFTQLSGESYRDFSIREDKFMAKLEKSSSIAVLKQSAKKLIIKIPYADGHAYYRVESENPFQVSHIPYGDAWQVTESTIRGLLLKEIVDWPVVEVPVVPFIRTNTLTDGSKTYDVILESGNTQVTIACVDNGHAKAVLKTLKEASITIDNQ